MNDLPAKDLMAEYTTVGFLDDDGRVRLSISHDRCTWYESLPASANLSSQVSLAFEHRITGCRTVQKKRT